MKTDNRQTHFKGTENFMENWQTVHKGEHFMESFFPSKDKCLTFEKRREIFVQMLLSSLLVKCMHSYTAGPKTISRYNQHKYKYLPHKLIS